MPMNDLIPLPDLPPGLTEAQVERVREAAGACRAAIELVNYPIEADITADLLVSLACDDACRLWHTGLEQTEHAWCSMIRQASPLCARTCSGPRYTAHNGMGTRR